MIEVVKRYGWKFWKNCTCPGYLQERFYDPKVMNANSWIGIHPTKDTWWYYKYGMIKQTGTEKNLEEFLKNHAAI